jgi:hypothetical protein
MRRIILAPMLVAILAVTPIAGGAQIAPDPALPAALRVFLDCRDGCDRDFLITELTWVDWMRERLDADLHVLVQAIGTGSGGSRYHVIGTGQRGFVGQLDTITFVTDANDSNDAVRRQLLRAIGQLLVPHAANGALGRYLTVTYAPPPGSRIARDRWDFWVFRATAMGSFNHDSRIRVENLLGSVTADRTTPQWKVRSGVDVSYVESRIQLIGIGDFISTRRLALGDVLVARSIGEHWSVGGGASVTKDELRNLAQATRLAAVIEWDLFPYEEFQRRRLTVLYTAGLRASRYDAVTLYGKTEESQPLHALDATYSIRKLWGDVRVSIQGEQTFDHPEFYRASLNTHASVNLGRHFTISVAGGASRDRGQRFLPRGTLSDSEALARQRLLFEGYRYFGQVGLSYRFGAIYNAIVNPRFEGLQLTFF